MLITEIGLNSRERLIGILSVGFPQRSTVEWVAFLNRINDTLAGKQLPECTAGDGVRIGWLLGNPESPDGILLGLPNPISGITVDQQPKQLNMSSWFVKEEHRAQAIWMLRKISNLPGHTFTDLTPSAAVAKMLPALKYSAISGGIVRLYTVQALLTSRRGWRVVDADQAIDRQADQSMAQALRDHLALGCIVLGLEHSGRCLPVVLTKKQLKPLVHAAEVIYLPAPSSEISNPRLAIPALARWLATAGVLTLDIEQPVVEQLTIPMLQRAVGERPRFARGDYPAGGINHLYSELVYV